VILVFFIIYIGLEATTLLRRLACGVLSGDAWWQRQAKSLIVR
jgi:hypothetical protein